MELQIGDLAIIKESGKSGTISSILEEGEDTYYCLGDDYMYWHSHLTKVPTKFKIGDKVKCVRNLWKNGSDQIGTIFEIKTIELDDEQRIIYSQNDIFFLEDELEKYSETDIINNHINNERNSLTTTVDKIINEIRENNPNINGNVKFGDVSADNRKSMYHIGDIMLRGNQINRLCELQDLSNLNLNIDCYSAMLNEKINDKSGLTEEQNNKLAEHIYKADIDRLFESDIIVGEILHSSIGSICEMAMLDGFKFVSEKMEEILNEDGSDEYKLIEIEKLKNKLNKDIYYHSFDLRNTDLKESGWRRSHSINQLLYAFMMHSATDKDILTWEEILKKLKERYE